MNNKIKELIKSNSLFLTRLYYLVMNNKVRGRNGNPAKVIKEGVSWLAEKI